MLYDISQMTPNDTEVLDKWYTRALKSPSVSRFLGIAGYNTSISMPESDWDGIVFMDDECHGILKLYFDHETATASFGIWVIPNGRSSNIARDLMASAVDKLHTLPNIQYLASRVQSTNTHGTNFSKRYLGSPWGSEPDGAYDRTIKEWVSMLHYKSSIDDITTRIGCMS